MCVCVCVCPFMSAESLITAPPPIITVLTITLCVTLHLCFYVTATPIYAYTLNPRSVIILQEFYRLYTSAVLHGSVMHIAMNMMSTYYLSSQLESVYGSAFFLTTIFTLTLINSLLYTITAYVAFIAGFTDLMNSHAVGYSGTIFALLVLSVSRTEEGATNRSLFGVVSVPSKLYPWALLLVLQVVMPNISFMGHLGGILVGELANRGLLNWLLPDCSYFRAMEEREGLLGGVVEWKLFRKMGESFKGFGADSRGGLRGVVSDLVGGARFAINLVVQVLETIKVMACGEGTIRWRWGGRGAPPHSPTENLAAAAAAAAVRRAAAARRRGDEAAGDEVTRLFDCSV